MIEWFPLAVGAAALIPSFLKKTELGKIEQVFRNLKFCINEDNELKFPEIIESQKKDTYNLYRFRLPLGLALTDPLVEKLSDNLTKSLNRTVMIHDARSIMLVFVFKTTLPEKWNFDQIAHDEMPNQDEWNVPIGRTYKELIWHNFDDIPHMTIAGMTRYGKTVLMKNIVTHLSVYHEDDVEFYIIDMKGGLEFNRYQKLKQVKYVASDPVEANRLLASILGMIRDDMQYFKENYLSNIRDTDIKRRRFIIVDEGAELTPAKSDSKDVKQLKNECLSILSTIARVSGALGYKLIYGTQYPTEDTLPRQIKQNADAKISFRLPTGYASKVALDEEGAEKLEFPGRAIYRTYDKKVLQVPYISDHQMWKRLEGYQNDNESTDQVETVDTDFIKFE